MRTLGTTTKTRVLCYALTCMMCAARSSYASSCELAAMRRTARDFALPALDAAAQAEFKAAQGTATANDAGHLVEDIYHTIRTVNKAARGDYDTVLLDTGGPIATSMTGVFGDNGAIFVGKLIDGVTGCATALVAPKDCAFTLGDQVLGALFDSWSALAVYGHNRTYNKLQVLRELETDLKSKNFNLDQVAAALNVPDNLSSVIGAIAQKNNLKFMTSPLDVAADLPPFVEVANSASEFLKGANATRRPSHTPSPMPGVESHSLLA